MTAAEEWRSAAGHRPQIFLQDVIARDIIFDQPSPLERAEQADLLDLLNNVRRIWIKGVLDTAVHRLARLEVGKAQSDVMPHPFDSIVELPDQTQRLLPAGQSLASIFEEFGRAMLILGAAGSGKTTSLLELARDLIDRAANDRTQPIPVVFNLSTWSGDGLGTWLVRELTVRYLVPAEQGDRWLRERRLILLLDGLDEVGFQRKPACVEAINAFVSQTKAGGLAVCSRLEDYTSLPVGLRVNGAISLQPLTPSQIEQYLTASGHQLDALRVAITLDQQLQTLAQSPLMLNVMSLAYDKLSIDDLTDARLDTVEERRRHLFTTYVTRMFQRRKGAAALYPPERTLPLLAWLARRMREHTQSDFLIERLQPDWLRTPAERWAYILTSRLLCGAVLGLVLGAILDVIFGLLALAPGEPVEEARDFLLYLGFGLLFGSVNGIMAGLMDIWRFGRHQRRAASPDEGTASQVVEVAGYVLPLVLLNWLMVSLVYKGDTLVTGLMLGVLIGLLFGLFFGVHSGQRGMSNDVRTVEALHWSWAGLRRSAGRGLLAGAAVGASVGFTAWVVGDPGELSGTGWLAAALLIGLLGAALGSVVGAAFGSLEGRIITRKTTPNQGIHLSARNALLAAAVAGPMIAALLFGAAAPILSATQAANTALVGGLFFGMLAGLRAGGFDVIQHYTLRVILAARGYTPLRYARFLDCAASLIFLQKAGGGYLFVHRLLLEHFAEHDGTVGPVPAPAAAEAVPALMRS